MHLQLKRWMAETGLDVAEPAPAGGGDGAEHTR
jgi:hypothetical protein